MNDPSSDTTMVPCSGCSRDLIVPKGRVISGQRRGQTFRTFCSARCQRRYVAVEGARRQEELHARRVDSSLHPEQ